MPLTPWCSGGRRAASCPRRCARGVLPALERVGGQQGTVVGSKAARMDGVASKQPWLHVADAMRGARPGRLLARPGALRRELGRAWPTRAHTTHNAFYRPHLPMHACSHAT